MLNMEGKLEGSGVVWRGVEVVQVATVKVRSFGLEPPRAQFLAAAAACGPITTVPLANILMAS